MNARPDRLSKERIHSCASLKDISASDIVSTSPLLKVLVSVVTVRELGERTAVLEAALVAS